MKKLAVTGGLGSGKSTVCQLLQEYGNAYIVDADEIVHKLLSSDVGIIQKVINLFGSDVIVNQKVSREKIAEKVFQDQGLLKKLEELLHPAVSKEIEELYQRVKTQSNYSLFVAEIPLFYESSTHFPFETVIAVAADEKIRKNRYAKSENEFVLRSNRLLSDDQRCSYAQYIIKNNSSLDDLSRVVKNLISNITENDLQ